MGVALMLALLAAGCGSGSDGEVASNESYERELRATMDELEEAYGSASEATAPRAKDAPARPVAQVVAELRAAQMSLRDAGNRLADVEPPAELESTHEELVDGVRDMADAIDLLIQAQELAGEDPRAAAARAREFATDPSFAKVQAAATKLADAGVDPGL